MQYLNIVLGYAQLFFNYIFDFLKPYPFFYNFFNILTCLPYTFGHLGAGTSIAKGIDKCHRPEKTLILYEFEGCPYCRKVRETLSVLDLDVIIYPCPRETLRKYGVVKDGRYRKEAKQIGGKAQFPFLIDPNSSVKMYESDAINDYLWKTYGNNAVPSFSYKIGKKLGMIPYMIGNLFRPLPQHGLLRTPSKKPAQPLELYAFDPSPFCKIVREALATLELPYILHNIGKGSTKKRKEFLERYGDRISQTRKGLNLIQVPLLIDSNHNIEMFESSHIVKYLFEKYQSGPTTNESFFDYGRDENKDTKQA